MELDINQLLYRQIKDGKQYDKLFVKVTCESTYLGKGMTDLSVSKMKEWVLQYAWQTEKIAPLLKKRSLQGTCNAIQDFLFWHFQYKKDNSDQMLRSPACSWYSRYDGIDCKSYSIVASCILTCLGIRHSIRRVRQPGYSPDLWTHVYIVVPVDQQTGKAAKGLYVIDGTIQHPTENYIEKSDIDMSMRHYGLNGAAPQYGVNSFYNYRGLNAISINTVKEMFQPGWKPSCINGSLNDSHLQATINAVVPAYNAMVDKINSSVATGSPTLLADINKMTATAWQMYGHATLKDMGDWQSACSIKAVKGYRTLAIYYFDMVNTVFLAWLKHYFNVVIVDTLIPNNTFDINIAFDKNSDVAMTSFTEVKSISIKPGTTEVKAFEFTAYAADKNNLASFNINTFLNTLTKVAAVFQPGGSTGSGTGTGSGSGTGTLEDIEQGGSKTTTMGAGILGFAVAAAGVGLLVKGFSLMPDKPATKAATGVATKRKVSKKRA